jgi:hypothetical protein
MVIAVTTWLTIEWSLYSGKPCHFCELFCFSVTSGAGGWSGSFSGSLFFLVTGDTTHHFASSGEFFQNASMRHSQNL